MGVWIVAFCFAIPQAIQFGVVSINGGHSCTVSGFLLHSFFLMLLFGFLFFFCSHLGSWLLKITKCGKYISKNEVTFFDEQQRYGGFVVSSRRDGHEYTV